MWYCVSEEFAVKLGHKHNTGDELKLTGEIVRGISHDSEEFYTTITEHNCKTGVYAFMVSSFPHSGTYMT